uniref:Uncharacterized protein n=1 Tax=Arundo donax TaxID=35708 RepID=A0A0A9HDV1_ARUDO
MEDNSVLLALTHRLSHTSVLVLTY